MLASCRSVWPVGQPQAGAVNGLVKAPEHTQAPRCATALHCWLLRRRRWHRPLPKHLLIPIQPNAPGLLQDRVVTDHIVSTAVTLHHRHSPSLHVTPARLSRALIMPITREVVRILTATRPTRPGNLTGRFAYSPGLPFPSPRFHCQFFFSKRCQKRLHRSQSRLPHVLVHFLDDGLAFLSLSFSRRKWSTHHADCSLL
jgi:hypothetical protein